MFEIRKPFKFWCQKVLPLVYDESLSYYEVLCKLTDYVNKLIETDNEIIKILEEYDLTIDELKESTTYLIEELEKVKNGEYISNYINALAKWIDENLQELVSKIVKYVVFGLTNDGYFVAYIPDSWTFMEFDTIVDSNDELYGHLLMRW